MKGHVKEIRPGTWRAWFDLPRGVDERRRQRAVTFKASGVREAQSQMARFVAEAAAGNIAPPSKRTVGAYLAEWLEKRSGDGLSPKTIETWGDLSRCYIVPYIGKVALEKLTPAAVDSCYAKLRASGRRRGEGGLSPRTLLHVHRFLSEALKSAVRLGLIVRNPCDGLGPQRVLHKEREQVLEFDGEALRVLLAAAEATWLHVPILLAAGLGMRRGETLGLAWGDIDLAAGRITVRQSVQQLRGQGLSVKRPKGEKARAVAMPAFLTVALRRHKGEQEAHRLRVGEAWADRGFVVADGFGDPRSPGALTSAFAGLVKRAGLPKITFHDLRHVNATLLLLQGVDVKVVSARLGHSSSVITRDLYQHVLQPMDEAAAQKTHDFFRAALIGEV